MIDPALSPPTVFPGNDLKRVNRKERAKIFGNPRGFTDVLILFVSSVDRAALLNYIVFDLLKDLPLFLFPESKNVCRWIFVRNSFDKTATTSNPSIPATTGEFRMESKCRISVPSCREPVN